jgi:hypothetical protein
MYSAEKSLEDGYYSNAVEQIKYAWAGVILDEKQNKCMEMLKKLQSLGYGTEIRWEQEARRDKKIFIFAEIIICFVMWNLFNWLFDGIIVWALELCVVLPVLVVIKLAKLVSFLKRNNLVVGSIGLLVEFTLIGLAVYFVFTHLLGWNIITNIVWLFGGVMYFFIPLIGAGLV